ncbi:ABC transporter permease subunit [Paracoccus caeni]|uniref:ABC transporter permease subunit n=1 Tax=Paracoccus caeni TaxID=657651 RepID=A0A934SHY8_9RHOB|nr:ABC transporter permease subunit [Paracoccus caeni]
MQFKANRIVPGEGLRLWAALPGAMGALVTGFLLALLIAGCFLRWPLWLRLAGAFAGVVTLVLALGAAADHLTPPDDKLARVAPGGGFWLLLLALGLMFADTINRLRPSLRLRWLLLAATLAISAAILATGTLDGVSVMREYAARETLFLREAERHLILTFGSLGLALLIGLPLGIALYQSRALRNPVMGGLNILQTIPSLALFGVMIPLFGWIAATVPGAAKAGIAGIGLFPALIALFLYALLPVVSNTLAGLNSVNPATREAAAGLGMTRTQILWQVLIPLAVPVLLAAVRIVLVQNIGLAVIAGLIGGGGFGTFVFQGLAQTAMDLVLLGALPTIALALVAGIALDLLVEATSRHPQGARP